MLLIWKNALYFSVIKWVWDSSCMWVSDQAGITVCMCDRWLFDRGSVCVLTGTLHRLLLAVGDRQTHIDPTALSVTLSLSLSPACRHFLKVMSPRLSLSLVLSVHCTPILPLPSLSSTLRSLDRPPVAHISSQLELSWSGCWLAADPGSEEF